MKAFMVGIALLLTVAVVWRYKDPGLAAGFAEQEEQSRPSLKFDNGSSIEPSPAPVVDPGRKGIHKCKNGSVVTYTDAPCEQGRHEQPMNGGTVTVVKGQRAPSAPTSPPTARSLLGNPAEPSLRDQAMERAINGP